MHVWKGGSRRAALEGRRDGRRGLVDCAPVRPVGLPASPTRGLMGHGAEEAELARRAHQSEAWIRERTAAMSKQGAASLDLAALDSPVWDEYRDRARQMDACQMDVRHALRAAVNEEEPREVNVDVLRKVPIGHPRVPALPLRRHGIFSGQGSAFLAHADGNRRIPRSTHKGTFAHVARSSLADPPSLPSSTPRFAASGRTVQGCRADEMRCERDGKGGAYPPAHKRPRAGPSMPPTHSDWTSSRHGRGRRMKMIEEEEEDNMCGMNDAGTVQKVRRTTKTYTCYEYTPCNNGVRAILSGTRRGSDVGVWAGSIHDARARSSCHFGEDQDGLRALMTPHSKAILDRPLPSISYSMHRKDRPSLLEEVSAEEFDDGVPEMAERGLPLTFGGVRLGFTGMHHPMDSAYENRARNELEDEDVSSPDPGPRRQKEFLTPPRSVYGIRAHIESLSPGSPIEKLPDMDGDIVPGSFVPASEDDLRSRFTRAPGLKWSTPPAVTCAGVKSILSIVRGLN